MLNNLPKLDFSTELFYTRRLSMQQYLSENQKNHALKDLDLEIMTHSVKGGSNPTEENGTPPYNGNPTLRSNASTPP